MPRSTRRSFLKNTTASGALALLPALRARGAEAAVAVPPSERVNAAFIGTAQRGFKNRVAFLETGIVNVVALCEVDPGQAQAQESAAAHPEARQFTDFRRMFDAMSDDIDAVVVSTPDHSHFAASMHAMRAGKHVYCEKPLAHTFGQCDRLMAAAAATGVVTQMGNQGHSSPNFSQFKAWTEAGVIKDVTRITAYMNKWRRWHGWGPRTAAYPRDPLPEGMDWEAWLATAPEHPFSERLHPGDWRSWFDYGSGCFGDWGPHLLDTAHRFLRLGYPETVTAVHRAGLSDLVYPGASTVRFDFPARGDMPPCEVTWYDGQENVPVFEPELGGIDPETGAWSPLTATDRPPGKVVYGKDLTFQGNSHGSVLRVVSPDGSAASGRELPGYETPMSNHCENFLLACKGQEEARSPFSVSGPLSQVFNLGVLAQRFGGRLEFDAATKRITNHELADAMLDPPPREGWEEHHPG